MRSARPGRALGMGESFTRQTGSSGWAWLSMGSPPAGRRPNAWGEGRSRLWRSPPPPHRSWWSSSPPTPTLPPFSWWPSYGMHPHTHPCPHPTSNWLPQTTSPIQATLSIHSHHPAQPRVGPPSPTDGPHFFPTQHLAPHAMQLRYTATASNAARRRVLASQVGGGYALATTRQAAACCTAHICREARPLARCALSQVLHLEPCSSREGGSS